MGRKDQVTTFDYIVKFAILLGFALSAILVFSFVYLKRGGRPRHRWLAVSIWSMYVGGFTAVLRQIEHHIGVHFADAWALIAIFGALKYSHMAWRDQAHIAKGDERKDAQSMPEDGV
jgi:hypothetical protein